MKQESPLISRSPSTSFYIEEKTYVEAIAGIISTRLVHTEGDEPDVNSEDDDEPKEEDDIPTVVEYDEEGKDLLNQRSMIKGLPKTVSN